MLIYSCKTIDLGRVRAKNLAFKQEKQIKIGSFNVSVIEGLLTVSLFCFGFIYFIIFLVFPSPFLSSSLITLQSSAVSHYLNRN